MNGSHVLVQLGEERYALAAEDVLEVGGVSDRAPLPGAPAGVAGLHNYRGNVVPLLDLASLVGAGSRKLGEAMVIVEHDGRRAALAVDAVLAVGPLDTEGNGRDEAAPLRSSVLVDGSVVGLLDTDALLAGVGTP